MTQEELSRREIDLDIEITPEIEDAFYFVKILEEARICPSLGNDETIEDFEKRIGNGANSSVNAGKRIGMLPAAERLKAIRNGYKMLENIEKYGVACKAWEK